MAMYEENGSNTEGEEFKLFVGGLHWETKQEELKAYFNQEPYGPIKSVTIKMHLDDKEKSRCFGFVEFATREGMDAVLRDKDEPGHWIGERKIDPKPAQPPTTTGQRIKKIFVGGVPPDLSEEIIRDHFETFGEIDEIALVKDKDEPSKRRGFIFITYMTTASVDNVVTNKFHELGPEKVRVEVKKAVPKDQQARGKYGSPGGGGNGGGGVGGRGGGFQPAYPQAYAYPGYQNAAAYGFYGGGYGNYAAAYGYGGGYGTQGGQSGGYAGGYGPPAGGTTQGYSDGGTVAGGGGTAPYRYTGGPGGPMKSNYHQGSTNFHPYSR